MTLETPIQRRALLHQLGAGLLTLATLSLVGVAAASTEEVNPQSGAESLGLSLDRLLAGLGDAFPRRDAGMGTLFSGPGSVSDRFFSDNAHATLETLGPVEAVIALRYLYALRDDDHPEATGDNRRYAFELLRNVFPDWPEAAAWLQAAIEKAEGEADSSAKAIVAERRGLEVKLRYFVGATASIELQILPKGSYI